MTTITVRKLDFNGQTVFAYPGTILARTATAVSLEAFFTRSARLDLGYTVFEQGDRFVEHYYSDRWYNIFEIYAARTGRLRGWYCNLTRPALIEAGQVSAVDLALDVWVDPDGQTQVLDEAEFTALPLAPDDFRAVRAACAELLDLAAHRAGPFARIETPHPAEEG